MLKPLTHDELARVLDHWTGHDVAVRVVSESDDLIAVFQGEIGARSNEKHPAAFWPLLSADPGAERSGIYLHPERFEDAAVHVGGTVIEVRQGRVTLNLRRL